MRLLPLLLWSTACAHVRPADPIPPHDSLTIDSAVLGEARVINVALPPGYDGERPFDVVYMPDGAVDEDFPHLANTLAALMAAGEVPPVLLVGIANTQRRRDLTGPTSVASDREVAPVVGGSAAFRRFLREELLPTIEARYRVTSRRSLIGESLAGLFVLETFFLEPDLFTGYSAHSPSLWWDDHALVRRAPDLLAARGARAQALYLTTGDETDIGPFTDALGALLTASAPEGLRWRYEPRKREQHHTIFRATTAAGLRWMLAPPAPPGAVGGR